MYAVIMAGGIGKRFWPRSRRNRPKQLIDIVGSASMLQLTWERLKLVTDPRKIYIVAGQDLAKAILENLPDFSEKNLIIEPSGKNTAPCIGLTATIIHEKDPNAVMGVFPSDHLIQNQTEFKQAIDEGLRYARDHVALVTFGIHPTRPATGYGYIQYDPRNPVQDTLFRVKTFAEKPNIETARRFLASGEFLWNSGMFIWKTSSILSALKMFLPELHESLQLISRSIGQRNYNAVLKQEWATISSTSIDYGVMEKAKNVFVVKGQFDWSDVGSWDSVFEIKDKDANGNVLTGKIMTLDTTNCLIHSRRDLVATIGVKDLIIIKSKGALLIVSRHDSERVKELVDELERTGQTEHL